MYGQGKQWKKSGKGWGKCLALCKQRKIPICMGVWVYESVSVFLVFFGYPWSSSIAF